MKQLWQGDASSIEHQAYLLEKVGRELGREVFYAAEPEVLRCALSSIVLKNKKSDEVEIQAAPSGVLYHFLKRENKARLLIINWSNFNAKEIVKWNSILDEDASSDGIVISKDIQIIGLQDPEAAEAYLGADFLSRFDERVQVPFTSEQWQSFSKGVLSDWMPEQKEDLASKEAYVIELYESQNWHSILYGHLSLTEKGLRFQPGKLQTAIASGKSQIILNNAPWQLVAFQQSMRRIVSQRHFTSCGQVFELPESLKFSRTNQNNWVFKVNAEEKSHYRVSLLKEMPTECIVINSSSFYSLLGDYQCKKNYLIQTPGLLARHMKQSLSLYVTHPLSVQRWSQLFDEAKKHEADLRLHLAPGVQLPEGLQDLLSLQTEACSMVKKEVRHRAQLVLSTHPQESVRMMQEEAGFNFHEKRRCVCLSELKSSDILTQLQPGQRTEELIQFSEQKSDLFTWLTTGKEKAGVGEIEEVILYGHIHEKLSQQLASLFSGYIWYSGQKQLLQTKVRIIADRDSKLDYVPNPEIISDHPSSVMHDPIIETRLDSDSIGGVLDESIVHSFQSKRSKAVEHVLEKKPYVFLTGPTGVGKSTFMQAAFESDAVYHDMSAIVDWAKDDSKNRKILIIDEANLGTSDLTVFEDLFHQKPSIYHDGQYYPLTENHKVVFAGNPHNYGGERHEPALFKHHGLNAVQFEALPEAVLFHQGLKSILEKKISDEETQQAIAKIIFSVYRKVNEMSQGEPWISARELKTMASFVMIQYHKNVSVTEVTKYYAHCLARQCLPESQYETFRAWADVYLNTKYHPRLRQASTSKQGFTFVASHHEVRTHLESLLLLREHKQNNLIPNEGLLSGLVLEGPSGVGKSGLIKTMLVIEGFKEGQDFIYIPVSMGIRQKQERLVEAFHLGQIVIMDEINTQVMSEQLLNSLLMGTDLKGQIARKPGFTLIGTQNPITLSGRQAMSMALKRRMIHCSFNGYCENEMIQILEGRGIASEVAEQVTREFLQARDFAREHHKDPEPVFRDLLKVVGQIHKQNIKGKDPVEKKECAIPKRVKSKRSPLWFFKQKKRRKHFDASKSGVSCAPSLD